MFFDGLLEDMYGKIQKQFSELELKEGQLCDVKDLEATPKRNLLYKKEHFKDQKEIETLTNFFFTEDQLKTYSHGLIKHTWNIIQRLIIVLNELNNQKPKLKVPLKLI